MSGIVDIHAHVLPGIDDGPETMDQAVNMVVAAAAAGITTLAATPHLRADFPAVQSDEIADRLADLRAASAADELGITLVPGGECGLTWALEARPDELAAASYAQRGEDLLIETPSSNTSGLLRMLYSLQIRGYRITLAHPERTVELQAEPEQLRELVAHGIMLAVNGESLLGSERNSGVRKLARWLCRERLVHAVASDSHRAHGWRPIDRLPLVRETLAGLEGALWTEWVMRRAPEAIIEGRELPPQPTPEGRPRRRMFRRR